MALLHVQEVVPAVEASALGAAQLAVRHAIAIEFEALALFAVAGLVFLRVIFFNCTLRDRFPCKYFL